MEKRKFSHAAVITRLDICSNTGLLLRETIRNSSFHRKYVSKKRPGCQSEACFHLGLDGTGVKLGTDASGLIKSGCEVLALQ